MNRILAFIIGVFSAVSTFANPGKSFRSPVTDPGPGIGDIHSAKLYRTGDQTSFPLVALNSIEALELHFDDLDADVKNYYYTYELCNADWSPSILKPFEYVRGFPNTRITNYRRSSATTSRYTHYQAALPDRNSYPTKAGNYLIKVFINGDTTQLAFEKRFVVYDNQVGLTVQLQQPYGAQLFGTHHKLNIAVQALTNNRLNLMGPQDFTVVVLQNNNWVTALHLRQPTIYRGNYYEYSDESITAIPAGMEWRWLDLRSLRLLSERMESINSRRDTTQIYVRRDAPRNGQMRVQYRDNNGAFTVEALDNANPFWQSEYGQVHFSYAPPGGKPYNGRDLYIFGELTDWGHDADARMTFNEETGLYESSLMLKQGYYNYLYGTVPEAGGAIDFGGTEGSNWATDNQYTVLVYFRAFGTQYDQLVGASTVNSVFGTQQR